MNVLSITIAKSFIDGYVSVTIQLPPSVQYGYTPPHLSIILIPHFFRLYHIALIQMVTGWLLKRVIMINKRFGYCNRENVHHDST